MNFIFLFFTLTVYIRIIIEGYMMILLSCEQEIYKLDFSDTRHIVSFSISCFMVLVLLILTVSIFFASTKAARNPDFDFEKSYFREVFTGTNATVFGRLTVFLTIFRIMVCITWIVCAQSLQKSYNIIGYFCIQIIFTVIKYFKKPFEENTDNVIEYINDIFYLYASGWLIYYNTESRWTDWALSAYMIVISVNGLMISAVQVYAMIKGC